MSVNIGDVVAVTKLAYDVYSKGFLVARAAPDEFRQLIHELSIFKSALWGVSRAVENGSELNNNDPVRSLIRQCLTTLSEFADFVGRYEQLGE